MPVGTWNPTERRIDPAIISVPGCPNGMYCHLGRAYALRSDLALIDLDSGEVAGIFNKKTGLMEPLAPGSMLPAGPAVDLQEPAANSIGGFDSLPRARPLRPVRRKVVDSSTAASSAQSRANVAAQPDIDTSEIGRKCSDDISAFDDILGLG
eukprot:gnl/TRDRNA2_/TRDRNA2_167721_c2_seq3.p2 gnl/TRDRNA2_/TRDRNA2_167721_c2~~gnl/TRDRNA2_/TRDRNA2_167721_c2_seq3.p2  ORF type:complete len:152 (+),score=19.66 gnl/TRDRNA2_/TRDRNA2_167721_c2_seq3:250-705(+)